MSDHHIKNPHTPEEWQNVVNLAEAYLLLHDARLYGLVTGGLVVHADRCVELLAEGKRRGWVPRKTDVDALIDRIVRGEDV